MIHHAYDLRYRVYDGSPPLEGLRVLEERTVLWGEWTVTFCVLAASHAIALRTNRKALTEILACAAPDCELPLVASARPGIAEGVCAAAHGLTLDARFWIERNAADRLAHDVDEQLFATYPGGADARVPLTRIGWRCARHEMLVETLHTYPEEGRAVRSESRFRMERP